MSDPNTDSPKSRLLSFCHASGLLRNKDIERAFGLGNGYFSSTNCGLNSDVLAKVINMFHDINIKWLITGRGSMYEEQSLGFGVAEYDIARSMSMHEESKIALRAYSSVESFTSGASFLPPVWHMIPKKLVRNDDDILIRLTDEALCPEYKVGDYILFSEMILPHFEDKKLVLCTLNDGSSIIRVAQYMGQNSEIIHLSAINTDKNTYPDIVCPASDIQRCYEAINVFGF